MKLNEQLNTIEKKLLNELHKYISDTVNQINKVNECVSYVESQCTEIVLLKVEIKSLKAQIKHQENLSESCALRFNGIPFEKKTRNLMKFFERVCSAINISTPAYKSIFRLQNGNIKLVNSSDAVILVKLCNFVFNMLVYLTQQLKSLSQRKPCIK